MTRTEAKRLKLTKTLEEAHAMADRFLSNARAANKRKSGRPPRAAGTDKAAKREERRERLAAIVAEVRGRSEDDCQTCGNPGHQAHHVLSGPDRRRRESAGTMLWICNTCHHLWHAGNVDVLLMAADYCNENGMREAERAIGRRLEKVERTRAMLAARREGETTP